MDGWDLLRDELPYRGMVTCGLLESADLFFRAVHFLPGKDLPVFCLKKMQDGSLALAFWTWVGEKSVRGKQPCHSAWHHSYLSIYLYVSPFPLAPFLCLASPIQFLLSLASYLLYRLGEEWLLNWNIGMGNWRPTCSFYRFSSWIWKLSVSFLFIKTWTLIMSFNNDALFSSWLFLFSPFSRQN